MNKVPQQLSAKDKKPKSASTRITKAVKEKFLQEFIEWFTVKYMDWAEKLQIDLKKKAADIITDEHMSYNQKMEKVSKLEKKFMEDRKEFIVKTQYEYYDMIFDRYNAGKIDKKLMVYQCKELASSIEEYTKMDANEVAM